MKTRLIFLQVLLLSFLLVGCGKPTIRSLSPSSKVLAFGDSLTYGYGAEPEASYPSVLAKQLSCTVVNSGESGEDTAAGLSRLSDELKKHRPDLVVLCYGGNDLLQNRPYDQIAGNLRRMIGKIQDSGADVVLVGVPQPGLILRVPDFFEEIANESNLPYEGRILKEVLSRSDLKSDYIHPNAEGYRLLAERIALLIQTSER